MTSEIIATLVRVNLAASAAILLVLALRPGVLRWFGARLSYARWLIVPLAIAATFAPAQQVIELVEPLSVIAEFDDPIPAAELEPSVEAAASKPPLSALNWRGYIERLAVAVWLAVGTLLLSRSIIGARRFAADPTAGPALVGTLRPRLRLPTDFTSRFTAEERALILAHEEQHCRSGHSILNSIVELARCVAWFNPLAHLAARRFRVDQELACDAAVVTTHPDKRRVYADALLKAQVSPSYVPLVCTWTSRSAGILRERITLLGRPSAPVGRILVGAGLLTIVNLAVGFTVWAQLPEQRVIETARPPAVWTSSSEAPEGTLTHQLEAERHDAFIERAQAGNITVVFFGSTDTEKWSWPLGRDIWEEAFGARRAANFGSQGTGYRSLIWRMQNGELDGYQAKVVVLNPTAGFAGDPGYAANVAGIIDEVRVRQPQAKILLVGPLPRASATPWRSQNQALAALADDETIFFIDISHRFFHPDGSFNYEMSALGGSRTPAYEAWAEELVPWLDRFAG